MILWFVTLSHSNFLPGLRLEPQFASLNHHHGRESFRIRDAPLTCRRRSRRRSSNSINNNCPCHISVLALLPEQMNRWNRALLSRSLTQTSSWSRSWSCTQPPVGSLRLQVAQNNERESLSFIQRQEPEKQPLPFREPEPEKEPLDFTVPTQEQELLRLGIPQVQDVNLVELTSILEALRDDFIDNPRYYANILGTIGGFMTAILLGNVIVDTISTIPFLYNFFEMVGLGYMIWVAYKFVLRRNSLQTLDSVVKNMIETIRK